MERRTFALKLTEGKQNDFRQAFGQLWPELTAGMDEAQISNFSMWSAEDLIFGYYEQKDGAQNAQFCSLLEKLSEAAKGCFVWISAPGETMRLMYHNFGIVRENKELIRHRVFMTRLKPDCAEEYKRRHDALVEARGGIPDPGPDSNFSIWSAGGYIFGYDEIDVTMEKEETPEDHEATVSWETRQLGIMDWITNDVDWMTGEVHAQIRRFAWHN